MTAQATYAQRLARIEAHIAAHDLAEAASELVSLRRGGGMADSAGASSLPGMAATLPPPTLIALVRALLAHRGTDGGWHTDAVLGALCPLLPPELPPDLVRDLLLFAADSAYDMPVMTLAGLVAQQLRHGPLPQALLATMHRRQRESLWLRQLTARAANSPHDPT
ncbi:hypothetical protein QEZ54_15550 [Catellatospora sp. KI3]|uniref:hypothetical protein n=1 Tax=Catellatospora sp. KI3 TaxID=3041620 RepID=UPI002482E16F|nr:hypothetical protein [Catellatospora sp. KI3]MDI1462385.1 hypothetical protein [Catellatospora sp. KI3]